MTLMRKKLLKNPPLKMMIHQGKQIMLITLLVVFFNFAQFTSYCGRFISISAAFCSIFMLVKIHLNLQLRPPLISDHLSKIPKVLTVSKLSYVCRTSLNAGYNDFLIIAFFSVYLWILNLFQWPGWGRLLWLFTHLYQRTNSQLCSRKNNQGPR